MALEIWIVLGLLGTGLAAGVLTRLRRRHTRQAAEPQAGNKVYPLW